MTGSPAGRSLRWRLLAATIAALALALLLAGVALTRLFREHAEGQFRQALRERLDEVTARVDFDTAGRPVVAAQGLVDPRWSRPFSGQYWQIDGPAARGVQRSRSLWDQILTLPADAIDDGSVHVHDGRGPGGEPLLLLERSVRAESPGAVPWRVVVAASTEPLDAAQAAFQRPLAWSLVALFALLVAAAWAQVAVGLAPLAALRRGLERVRAGGTTRLEGRYPAEVQPLVDDFHAVLDLNRDMVERARQHAGNLAHAVKTPLAALQQVGEQLAREGEPHGSQGRQIVEQVALARRHVDWHLARARAAGGQRPGAGSTAVAPVLQGLARVLGRLHAGREVDLEVIVPDDLPGFAGDEQDLQEMAGNLMDNAMQWARGRVRVEAMRVTPEGADDPRAGLRVRIDDDGPGIAAAKLAALPQRGARLDTTRPGNGLGLAICDELARLYGGSLTLGVAPLGGLRAELLLPATSSPRGR